MFFSLLLLLLDDYIVPITFLNTYSFRHATIEGWKARLYPRHIPRRIQVGWDWLDILGPGKT